MDIINNYSKVPVHKVNIQKSMFSYIPTMNKYYLKLKM